MRVQCVAIALTVGMLTACAGAGGSGSGDDLETEAACELIGRLEDAAVPVEEVDVADPAAFEEALDEAVAQYVATLEDLHDFVPDSLEDELDRLEAAASQYRFEDALEARVALDEYAQATCAAPVTTTTEAE